MEKKLLLLIILGSASVSLLIFLSFAIYCLRRRDSQPSSGDIEVAKENDGFVSSGDLIRFQGGEHLTVQEILDAPGEVIGKSSSGTLYSACLLHSNTVTCLRFLRPTCTLTVKEVVPIVELLGRVRHPNLVPLTAFYTGPKEEKLMVHPYYGFGNLSQFIRGEAQEARKWSVICGISVGIARATHHLHTSYPKPIIHGNLKSKNVMLDLRYNPHVSDFGLHLLLNPTAGQQMLELSASQGYRAPELIKMKDVTEESDIYSLGLIFLELLAGKEPINRSLQDSYLPNALRSLVLDDRVTDLCRLFGLGDDQRDGNEDKILGFFRLAMSCCSPSRLLRPDIKHVLRNLKKLQSRDFWEQKRWSFASSFPTPRR